MRELVILNRNNLNLKNAMASSALGSEMTRYKIESKTFGPFGPVASFEIMVLDQNKEDVLMDLKTWRSSLLYKAFQRFTDFDFEHPERALDVAFALKALLKHPFADFKTVAFQKLMCGSACKRDEDAGQIILNISGLKALVSAVRPAVEYAYYSEDKELQEFWNDIFVQTGARYSDGMISGTFGMGPSFVEPSMTQLLQIMPKIESVFYRSEGQC
tara:strand:+ start:216768 stop:217412 length:645 start_codon:yes stop_codon:yes gene_type:complete